MHVDDLDVGFTVRAFEFSIDPEPKKEKYNRAQAKREFERRVKDEWEK